MRTYTQFIARELEDATAEPLAIQLERRGRSAEFSSLMARFVDAELATFLVEERGGPDEDAPADRASEIDATTRVLESLRMDAEARARRRPIAAAQPIDFPDPGQS